MADWQAVFIDRDGTIGGDGHFIHPRDFVLYQGAQESIGSLKHSIGQNRKGRKVA